MNPILKKIHLEGKEFITSPDIKEFCETFGANYNNTIRYLTAHDYLLRIFKGIFYVRSFDEIKMGRQGYSYLELVARGMELKGVTNWYFGLRTALKLNNVTHEHFTVDYVLNDTIFRSRPISIAGSSFKFIKMKKDMLSFGVVSGKYRHSDLEKTILDIIYLGRYNGIPGRKLLMDVSGYMEFASMEKIMNYAAHYPKTVARMLEGFD